MAEPENHAQQAGRDDSCLFGAADRLIVELHAAVDQDTAAAAVGEEGAENEEVEQGAQRSDQRRAEDAILAVHQDFHQFGKLMPEKRNRPGIYWPNHA